MPADPAGRASPSESAAPVVLAFALAPTSTAVALFRGTELLRSDTVVHTTREHAGKPVAQRDLHLRSVRAFLEASSMARGALAAVAVHAGAPRPVATGTYRIDESLLREAERHHAAEGANVAAAVAHAIAAEFGCPAFVVDPASRGECDAAERVAHGACERSLLAMKAAARRHALAVDRPLEALRLVLVHIGAAVTLCVQSAGRVGDVHHALDPASIDLNGALARAEAGDGRASVVLHGAANEIAKVVGALATVLEGEVDAVIVTGVLEHAGLVVAEICRRVEWIAPVFLYRDQDELLTLAEGAIAVLAGGEPLKRYA